jgi:hypothetical protein
MRQSFGDCESRGYFCSPCGCSSSLKMMSGPKTYKIDKLFAKIERSGLSSLTEAERFCFGIFWLFREVNNGGFHTFFFNDAGRFALDAMAGLEKIGAHKTADILRRAINVFPEGKIPIDQEARRSLLASLPDESQWNILGELSGEFFGSNEDVAGLVNSYIDENQSDFPVFSAE